jgi:hypothetical protein
MSIAMTAAVITAVTMPVIRTHRGVFAHVVPLSSAGSSIAFSFVEPPPQS